jgi:hypothetical protein
MARFQGDFFFLVFLVNVLVSYTITIMFFSKIVTVNRGGFAQGG